ncbi:hypothetical protein COB21_02930 [Candidatus Aerophobetes bacterium]|uniref:Uncharacterized protein n=1 Tax=Aerophobetes bacterium TaxID=2030807 RepID=A0A2A4X4J5_UNCAE|nr:MAG: hypothetical protein COB21_02930 [Candidatus Aerophobetes bacterium]
MQKKWPIYLLITCIIVIIESLAIWIGTEEFFNVIHVEGKMVWILHPASRIFLWFLTTICEIIAVGRVYFWPTSSVRSYMMILIATYFSLDFIMPLTLSLFPQEILSPVIFTLLAMMVLTLIILASKKEKIVSFLFLPSLVFMSLRAYFKWHLLFV